MICVPQGEFTTLDAKAARHVGKFMTEVAAAQFFGDNGMNIWHGVAPSSLFFTGSRSSMAPSWRVAFLTGTQSTTGQSGVELIGAHGAKLYARERAAIRKSSNKRQVPFLHIAVLFLGSKSGPKTGSTNLPSN